MSLEFRRNTVTIMKTFLVVANFLSIRTRDIVDWLKVSRKQLQDVSAATSNNLTNKRHHMLPVAKRLRENPPPFRFLIFGWRSL